MMYKYLFIFDFAQEKLKKNKFVGEIPGSKIARLKDMYIVILVDSFKLFNVEVVQLSFSPEGYKMTVFHTFQQLEVIKFSSHFPIF